MAKLYASKIRNKDINPMTGEIWVITDVPARWAEDVRAILDAENGLGD